MRVLCIPPGLVLGCCGWSVAHRESGVLVWVVVLGVVVIGAGVCCRAGGCQWGAPAGERGRTTLTTVKRQRQWSGRRRAPGQLGPARMRRRLGVVAGRAGSHGCLSGAGARSARAVITSQVAMPARGPGRGQAPAPGGTAVCARTGAPRPRTA